MRRNPFVQLLHESRAQAARDALTPAARSGATSSSQTSGQAVAADPDTGEIVAVGLVEVTPLGTFRVSA